MTLYSSIKPNFVGLWWNIRTTIFPVRWHKYQKNETNTYNACSMFTQWTHLVVAAVTVVVAADVAVVAENL